MKVLNTLNPKNKYRHKKRNAIEKKITLDFTVHPSTVSVVNGRVTRLIDSKSSIYSTYTLFPGYSAGIYATVKGLVRNISLNPLNEAGVMLYSYLLTPKSYPLAIRNLTFYTEYGEIPGQRFLVGFENRAGVGIINTNFMSGFSVHNSTQGNLVTVSLRQIDTIYSKSFLLQKKGSSNMFKPLDNNNKTTYNLPTLNNLSCILNSIPSPFVQSTSSIKAIFVANDLTYLEFTQMGKYKP